VQHQKHLELTAQAITYPIAEFRAIIDAIPTMVNINKVDYTAPVVQLLIGGGNDSTPGLVGKL
jgi:hypothetical protein